jgi:alkylation response protein AidB-like acyl-CoA dehydrogenase
MSYIQPTLDPKAGYTRDPAELEAFRAHVRDKIRKALPEDIRRKAAQGFIGLPKEMTRRWNRILFELGGWGCPNWSVEDGGPGWSLEQQYIFETELALADAPRTSFFNHAMLGPAILEFGTEDQKRKFIPDLAIGKTIVCQGYSEPNAGSDLASLKARAERDGDHYLLNGSKMWTTNGHQADLMFGLFRTSTGPKKQDGISVVLIDMSSKGITIQPIITIDGSHEVNQVFFDNVRIPVENRLGDENNGWTISKIILSYERFGSAETARSVMNLARLKRLASEMEVAGGSLITRPDIQSRITDLEIDLRSLEKTERRLLLDGAGGAEASLLKIRGSEIQNEILELTQQCLGLTSVYDLPGGGDPAIDTHGFDQATRLFLNMRKTIIYSGTNEIQKNVIAKAVLGLR